MGRGKQDLSLAMYWKKPSRDWEVLFDSKPAHFSPEIPAHLQVWDITKDGENEVGWSGGSCNRRHPIKKIYKSDKDAILES